MSTPGTTILLGQQTNPTAPIVVNNTSRNWASPFTPRYREVFYSSIPVAWTVSIASDSGCITCLSCARDTFLPPSTAKIIINGVQIN